MRRILCTLIALGLVLSFEPVSVADDADASAILARAVKAHLGDGKDAGKLGTHSKSKGTISLMGMDLDITQEVFAQIPDKFKEVVEMSIAGQNVKVTTVFNGKEGWIKVNDMNIKVEKELLDEFKEIGYMMGLSQGIFLKDKSLKLSLIGEAKVNGKPAVGVKVGRAGKKEMDFYFDKSTGLMSKLERRTRDFMSGQEVTEERIISAYQDIKGRKAPKKVQVLRDGKKFLDVEVVDIEFLEKVDDGEFAQP